MLLLSFFSSLPTGIYRYKSFFLLIWLQWQNRIFNRIPARSPQEPNQNSWNSNVPDRISNHALHKQVLINHINYYIAISATSTGKIGVHGSNFPNCIPLYILDKYCKIQRAPTVTLLPRPNRYSCLRFAYMYTSTKTSKSCANHSRIVILDKFTCFPICLFDCVIL